MSNRIPELVEELKTLITPETYEQYKTELDGLGFIIDAEGMDKFYRSHPIERAVNHG